MEWRWKNQLFWKVDKKFKNWIFVKNYFVFTAEQNTNAFWYNKWRHNVNGSVGGNRSNTRNYISFQQIKKKKNLNFQKKDCFVWTKQIRTNTNDINGAITRHKRASLCVHSHPSYIYLCFIQICFIIIFNCVWFELLLFLIKKRFVFKNRLIKKS